jgi:protein SCO1
VTFRCAAFTLGSVALSARLLALAACTAIACTACGASRAPTQHATAGSAAGAPWRGTTVDAPSRAPDFALRDQSGRVVRLAARGGKVTAVTFLFTQCRDVCPLIAENLASAVRRLGPRGADVRVLGVSVDPTHDTPRAVRAFISRHRLVPQFRYLVGTRAQLRPVWQAYNVLAAPKPDEAVDHTAYIVLLDRHGLMRVFLPPTASGADIAHDLRRLLSA